MKDANKDFPELMDIIDEFVIAIDKNGIILEVNQAWIDFCTAHGVRESCWKTGANYFALLEEKGKEHELQSIKQVIVNTGTECNQMYPFLLKENTVQWFQIKARGVEWSADQSYGAIIYHKPAGLHSAQQITAETILESMTDGFVLLNHHLKLTYANDIAEKLLNRSKENLIGRELSELIEEVGYKFCNDHFERALKEQVVVEFVDFYKSLDIWLQVKVCPLSKGGLALYLQDISERKKTEAELEKSSYYDYLTNLPNRRSVDQKTLSLIEKRYKFSVFHININNMNSINAVHHYNVGNIVLEKVAEKLKELSNDKSHVGRLNGNEFIILKETQPKEKLGIFAEQIKNKFYKPLIMENSQIINVNVSIGIACFPYDAQTKDQLLSYAEIAMSEAKKVPGSFYSFFRPMMKTSRDRKSLIEKGMNGNLKDNGFYYTLQPQIDGNSGEIIGAEVLSRWVHPELGEVSPLEFIQVAEELGSIVPLTSHLLSEVFVQIKEWEKRFGWNLRIAINMTPSLLSNPDFFDHFFELMDQYEIPDNLIEIEITEQAELTYSPKTLENLLLCKSKGISIAIDDFGTGFSMISYLTHFPINKIKIDKSFIQKIGLDGKSEAVLKSLIQLARSIECEIVAEGVEQVEEAVFLQSNNCHIYQGYLYDKPLKVTDFEAKYLQTDSKTPLN